MGLPQIEHEIPELGDRPARIVTITRLPVIKGRPLKAKLIAAFPREVRSTEGGAAEDSAAIEFTIRLTQAAFSQMEYLIAQFGPSSMVDGVRVLSDPNVQEDLFGGRYDELYRWLWKCLEFNFGSVAGLLPAGGKELADVALVMLREKVRGASSKSQKESIGNSGASSPASDSTLP